MKFCTRCGSRMNDRVVCSACGALAYRTAHRLSVAEYPPGGNLPTFTFTHNIPFFGLIERGREVSVPFSYISGTLLEIRRYEDTAHPVQVQLWSQEDDPPLGSRDPIVGRESQPSIRNIVHLKLTSGVERSSVLTHVGLRAEFGSRITLVFPTPFERATNPVYDCAAIAAVDCTANDYVWSTAHPEIYALRMRLPEDHSERFADALASYLNGLCRLCLRRFRSTPSTAAPSRRWVRGAGAMKEVTPHSRFAWAALNSVSNHAGSPEIGEAASRSFLRRRSTRVTTPR
jgi:hypothetical protein